MWSSRRNSWTCNVTGAALRFFLVITVFALVGCAHPLVIAPDITAVGLAQETKSPKSIGYYFTEPIEKEVITSAGGGDQIKYKPYKDLETGLYKMYSSVFTTVSFLSSSNDPAGSKVDYIASVEISTSSSSPSLFTWPPTLFTLSLANNIRDAKGNILGNLRTSGEGRAEFNEFKGEFGLAGKRASQDALNKMQVLLVATPFLASAGKPKATDGAPLTKEERLKDLKRLYDLGLITESVFLERQRAVLNQ